MNLRTPRPVSTLEYWTSPIFVVGTGRCGSTLLRNVLTSHPKLAVPWSEYNNLWHPRLYPYRTPTPQAERVVDAPPFHSSPEQFTLTSLENWPIYQPLLIRATLMRFALRRRGRRALVVKSAMLTFLCARLLELYPRARFIFLFRDGEATTRSWVAKDYKKKWSATHTRDEYAHIVREFWAETMEHMSQLEKAGVLDDTNIRRVQYEDLCSNPGAVLTELAHFMGIEPDGYSFDVGSIKNLNCRHRTIGGINQSSRKFKDWMARLGYS